MLLKTDTMYFLPTLNTHTHTHTSIQRSPFLHTHPYLTNSYKATPTNVLPNVKLFVYYSDRFILITILYLLQGAYQVQATNRQQKHTKFCKFYLFLAIQNLYFLTTTFSDIL